MKYSIWKMSKVNGMDRSIKLNVGQAYANQILKNELSKDLKNKDVKVLSYKYGDLYETDKYTVWIEEA